MKSCGYVRLWYCRKCLPHNMAIFSDLCMSGCYHTYGSDFSVSKDVVYSGCNKINIEPTATELATIWKIIYVCSPWQL